MPNEDDEKYGALGATVKNDIESGVKDKVSSVVGTVQTAKNLAGFLSRDINKGINWLTSSPEEKAEAKKAEEKEKEEAEAAAEAKAEEEKAAAEAEEARMEALKETYILHTAAITCKYATRVSFVVIPVSHGEYIHGVEQINVGDSLPEINVRSFGVCTSPKNPSVQEAAKKVLEDVKKERKKGFMERVMDIFAKKPEEKVSDDLISKCAGDCTPMISTEWIDGKEDVLVDGKKAVLGKCKLQCGYDGVIEFYSSGQRE